MISCPHGPEGRHIHPHFFVVSLAAGPGHSTPLDPATFARADCLALHVRISQLLHVKGCRIKTNQSATEINHYISRVARTTGAACAFRAGIRRVRGPGSEGDEWWEA